MSFFTNLIANLVSGFLPSVISAFKGFDSQGLTPDYGAQHVAQDLGSMKDENLLSNYFRKATGSSLTDAEREANQWSRQQTLDAWERQMEADNTKYQRQVQDMQLAGINPMMAAGGSVSVPSASASGSVSPSAGLFNMDSLIQLFGLGAKLKNIEADTALKKSEADKNVSQTAGQDIINEYERERQRLQNEGLGIANDLNRSQIVRINKEVEEIDSRMSLQRAQTSNELEKVQLTISQALLARMNTYQIAEMIPYSQALMSAQTETAKASAALASVQALYQKKLIDDGYIDHMVKKLAADERYSVSNADLMEIKNAIKNGKNPWKERPDGVAQALLGAASILLDAINPLAGIIK